MNMETHNGRVREKEMEEVQPRSRTGEKEEAGLRGTSCTCAISSAYSGLHQYLAKREEEGNKNTNR